MFSDCLTCVFWKLLFFRRMCFSICLLERPSFGSTRSRRQVEKNAVPNFGVVPLPFRGALSSIGHLPVLSAVLRCEGRGRDVGSIWGLLHVIWKSPSGHSALSTSWSRADDLNERLSTLVPRITGKLWNLPVQGTTQTHCSSLWEGGAGRALLKGPPPSWF